MAVNVEQIVGQNLRQSGFSFPMVIPLIALTVGLALIHFYLETRRMAKLGNRIPGPPTLPFIGNAHYVLNKTHHGKHLLKSDKVMENFNFF